MILGAIIGDVVGRPYEFDNIKTKEFELVTERSRFSDDSIMTLAIANALRNRKKGWPIDEDEFKQVVIKSMRHFGKLYPHAGYGDGFKRWLKATSPKAYNSYGNGSAMRVSPVAWYFDDLAQVEKYAAITAKVSHNHPEGIKGAQATAAAIFLARTGKSKTEIKNYIMLKYSYDLNRTCDQIRPTYTYDVSCQGTVPEAIIAFLDGENFEDALRNAVSLGGDSDTLAAITCSIAEGMWGVPKEIEKMVRLRLDPLIMAELEEWELALADTEPEKIKNGITEVVFILDRSGSMNGLESDTIGGFNSTLEKYKKENNKAYVSTVLFDHEQIVLHDRVKIDKVAPITSDDYWVRGSTALLDAVGGAIHHIVRVHRYMSPSAVPEHTIFVIITDGCENASVKYTYDEVKSMIELEKEKYGWEFLFIGANIDAVEVASSIGISANRAVNYVADSEGTDLVYEGVSEAMCCMSKPFLDENYELDDKWREKIDEDYNRRGRR